MTLTPPPIPLPLLLELGQAFHSMLELEPTLDSVLEHARSVLASEGCSLWLLKDKEAEPEIKCVRAVGINAKSVMGSGMKAKKFLVAYRTHSGHLVRPDSSQHFKWMDAKVYERYFNINVRSVVSAPLVAREKLLGEIAAVNKIGKADFSAADYDFINALAEHVAVAVQNTQLFEWQNRTGARQKLLAQISRHLHQTLDIDELIPRVFTEVNKAINAEAQSIWLVDEEAAVIRCRFATGQSSESLKGFAVPLASQSVVGASVSKKKSIIIEDAQNDKRHASSADKKTGFITRSLMTVPLVLEEKAIGAIQAVNKRGGQFFNKDDLEMFRSIADSAALAVNNAQLVADLQNSYDLTLDALSAALDLRDRETEGHSRRVVEYTSRLAEQIGLSKEEIKPIRRGALIHDVGKIGVPDAVLLKPGDLDAKERKIIERHPQAGYDMLAGIPFLQEEIKIIICHQEKWDGAGYPRGLKGEEINLGARLFMIADTFDAITSNRPYRKGRSYEVARKIIEEESGKQFDPKAVEAFLAVPAEEWEQIRARVTEEVARRHNPKK